MKRNNIAIRFEKQFLNDLVEDESSCVEVQEQNYHLALHPFHLNNINESLKDILNKGIAKYDNKLGGILLGYQNIKLLSQSGVVWNDSFFIHIDIAASFFLFKPEVGKILAGTVNKKSKDHVGCLVHKTFNVSLPKPENEDDDDWVGSKVEIGQDILFRITFLNLEARLPYIRAEFVSILSEQDSGISTSEEFLEKNSDKTNKKPTKIVFENHSEDEEIKTAKKKKKKKHKEEESENDTSKYENDDVNQRKKKNKKHKRKSHKEEHGEPVESSKKKKSKHKHNDLSEVTESGIEENFSDQNRLHKSSNEELDEDKRFVDESLHDKKKNHKHQKQPHEESSYLELNSISKKRSKHKYDHSSELMKTQSDENVFFEKQRRGEREETKSDIEDQGIKKKKSKSKKRLHEEDYLESKDATKKKYKHQPSESSEFIDADVNIVIKNTFQKKKKEEEMENGKGDSSIKKKHKNRSYEKEYLESERADKKKEAVHDSSDVEEPKRSSKRKKNIKDKDSLGDLAEIVLQRALLNFSENQSRDDRKRKDKKDRKSKDATNIWENNDLSSSLPELNLSSLFNETTSSKSALKENFVMADNEDKASKKRHNSTSHVQVWENKTELLPDSDLEKIIQDVDKSRKHRNKKEDCDENLTKLSRKRQRSTSSDEFVTSVRTKKQKRD